MYKLFIIIAQAVWFIFPAYFANASPVVGGGGLPMDGGKKLSDGYRILGDGKTVRGFLFGWLVGSLVGFIQIFVWRSSPLIQSVIGVPVWGWVVPVLLSLGALSGDVVASFIKRRFGVQRGSFIPVFDQLDFILGALIVASPVWFPSCEVLITLLVLTPVLHIAFNRLAFELGLKSEPY